MAFVVAYDQALKDLPRTPCGECGALVEYQASEVQQQRRGVVVRRVVKCPACSGNAVIGGRR